MHHGEWMVVLIVAMVLVARAYRDRLGIRRRRDHGEGFRIDIAGDRAENDRLRDEIRSLKERIAVLERIATDSSTHLDREIEALRDRP